MPMFNIWGMPPHADTSVEPGPRAPLCFLVFVFPRPPARSGALAPLDNENSISLRPTLRLTRVSGWMIDNTGVWVGRGVAVWVCVCGTHTRASNRRNVHQNFVEEGKL